MFIALNKTFRENVFTGDWIQNVTAGGDTYDARDELPDLYRVSSTLLNDPLYNLNRTLAVAGALVSAVNNTGNPWDFWPIVNALNETYNSEEVATVKITVMAENAPTKTVE